MRIIALVKRILLQVVRDKRTLALLFIAPLLILTLMSIVFNGKTEDTVLGIENGTKQTIELLEDAEIVVKEYDIVSNKEEIILDDDLDGFLWLKDNEINITLLNDVTSIDIVI